MRRISIHIIIEDESSNADVRYSTANHELTISGETYPGELRFINKIVQYVRKCAKHGFFWDKKE